MGRGRIVCFCQVYFLALSVTFASLSSVAFNAFKSPLAEYELLLENWAQQPIIDIRVSFSNCTSEEEILNTYTWPGTANGCDCINSDYYVKKMYNRSTCNSTQLDRGCQSVQSIKKVQFELSPIANQSLQLFKLCGTRETNNNFYNNSPILDCPQNYLKCGTNPDYFYCTQEQKCPIFNVGFAISSTDIPKDTEVIQISNNLYFWKSRANSEELPLVEFRIDEGPGVCLLNHALGITPGRKDYPLMITSKYDCKRDPRFRFLNSMDELSFYTLNNQLGIVAQLPHYNISSNYTWGLYARNYVHWKQICRGTTFDDFKAQSSNLNNIYQYLEDIVFISAFYLLIIGIGYPILWSIFKKKCIMQMFIVEISLQIGFQILDAFFVISTFAQLKRQVNYTDDLIKQDCSDSVTQLTLQNLSETIESDVYTIHLVRFIFFFINWFIEFCVLLYFFVCWALDKLSYYNFISQQAAVYQQPQKVEQCVQEIKQVQEPSYPQEPCYPNPNVEFQQDQIQEPYYPNPNFADQKIEFNENDDKPPFEKQL